MAATSNSVLAVGIMSGTSCDGIDVALVRIKENYDLEALERIPRASEPPTLAALEVDVIAFESFEYNEKLKAALIQLCEASCGVFSLPEVGRMNSLLGREFAQAANRLIAKAGEHPGNIAFIASHGHTLCHFPDDEVPFTWQIGEGAIISTLTGCKVVCDFRPADVAVGGKGAPLVPRADLLLQRPSNQHAILLNIGGIANITLISPSPMEILAAFDTGPGNMLIDSAARKFMEKPFDDRGTSARSGTIDEQVLSHWMSHPFFKKDPPKATGREDFGTSFWDEYIDTSPATSLTPSDLLATLTELTARSIIQAIRAQLSSQILLQVAGGGAHNDYLLERLQWNGGSQVQVVTYKQGSINEDNREAVAFAVLGYETCSGRVGNAPAATGAQRHAVLGKICLPPPNSQ